MIESLIFTLMILIPKLTNKMPFVYYKYTKRH